MSRNDLADRAREDRRELGLTKHAAAFRGGISPVTWTRVENGENVQLGKLAGVDRGLAWLPGTALALLEGRTLPAALPDAPYAARVIPSRDPRLSDATDDELLAEIARRLHLRGAP